jgi:hypothetical protein
MPTEYDLIQSATQPRVARNIYMTPAEQSQYAQDVMGSDPYYRMMRQGPVKYQFPSGIETDEQAYNANIRAMQQNAVPSEFAQSMWMRQTPNGMIYTTADKLFYGSDFTDYDLAIRDRAVRSQGWMPVIEGR